MTGYDLKNSFKVLLELGVEQLPTVAHDCLLGAFIIDSLRRDQSLAELSDAELEHRLDIDDMDDDQLLANAGELAGVLHALSTKQGEQISEVTSLIKMAESVDWPVIPVLARMERAGIKIEPPFFKKLSDEMADHISDLEQTIYGYADQEFNISSPSQLSDILFVKLQLPTSASRKAKQGILVPQVTFSTNFVTFIRSSMILKNIVNTASSRTHT